jgi:large subunit ribosomal protein L15
MLDQLSPRPGATHRIKRVGRGPGTGLGKTAGRGVKGQGKRSAGRETPLWFEGGQMPLVRRVPKRGFFNIHRVTFQIVNLAALASLGDGATVDRETLVAMGMIRKRGGGLKILGEGTAPKNLTVKAQRISAGAREKIEAAGGSVELVK